MAEMAARRCLIIAAGLSTVTISANDLTRFSYSLLMPEMKVSLHWSFAVAGALNTANALGYLAGAVGGAALVAGKERWSAPSLVVLSALCVLATGLPTAVRSFVTLRFVGGGLGAITFISIGGIVTKLAIGQRPAVAAAMVASYFSGPGLGIGIAGAAIPAVAVAHVARSADTLCLRAAVRWLVPGRHNGGHELRADPVAT